MAKAGLERVTPLALPTLLIGANLPDIDVVSITSGHERNWSVKRFPKRLDDPLMRQAITTRAGATMLAFARYPFAGWNGTKTATRSSCATPATSGSKRPGSPLWPYHWMNR